MSGLLRRLTRRRPATADENRSPATESSDPAAAPADTPAKPGGQTPPSVWAGQAPATPESSSAAGPSSPAAEAATGPSSPAAEAAAGQSSPPGPPSGQSSESATAGGKSSPGGEQPTAVLPATGEQPLPAWTVAATPTAYAAQPAPPRDLPAGVDAGDLAAVPAASARRGKLRRRLRYLRHVRELLLRDLGGFTYEVHRTAGGTAQESHRRLTTAKAERISKLDEEVLALESRLGDPRAEVVLREPGIGGICHECGELHASDAHFCSRCGAPLDAKARAQRAAEAPATGSQATAEPQPASVLWAGGPRPAPEAAAEEPEAPQPPSEVTSQWLATDRPTTFSRAEQPDEAVAKDDAQAKADEPVAADEPATTGDEPVAAARPALDEPATAVELPTAGEPTAQDDAAKANEPDAKADEPAKADESVMAGGPALDEPATAVDTPAGGDPAAGADEPAAAAEEPAAAAEEPAAAADEPATDEAAAAPAKPKRVRKPRKRPPAKREAEPDGPGFEANGRSSDENVTPPHGDPVTSPREPGP